MAIYGLDNYIRTFPPMHGMARTAHITPSMAESVRLLWPERYNLAPGIGRAPDSMAQA